jgi:hypothetical protein
MKAYKKGRKLMIQHHVFLLFAVLNTFFIFPAFTFLREDEPLAPVVMGGIALVFWIAFFLVNRQIDD